MKQGKIFISCGCEYTGEIHDLDKLWRVWTQGACTRDPDNPFVVATISGYYCDKCWKIMNQAGEE